MKQATFSSATVVVIDVMALWLSKRNWRLPEPVYLAAVVG